MIETDTLATPAIVFHEPTKAPLILRTIAAAAVALSAYTATLLYTAAPLPTLFVFGASSLATFTIHLLGTWILGNRSKQKASFHQLSSQLQSAQAQIEQLQKDKAAQAGEIEQLKEKIVNEEVECLMGQLDFSKEKEKAIDLIKQYVLAAELRKNDLILLNRIKEINHYFSKFLGHSSAIEEAIARLSPEDAKPKIEELQLSLEAFNKIFLARDNFFSL